MNFHGVDKQEVIDYLRGLGTGQAGLPERDRCCGICSLLRDRFNREVEDEVMLLARRWEKYSGSPTYPVPGEAFCRQYYGDEELAIISAMEGHGIERSVFLATRAFQHNGENQWGTSPYADLRRELCLFLADELEKTL